MSAVKQKTCKQRVKPHLKSRLNALREMFDGMQSDDDSKREEAMQDFADYGLSLDYVPADTFNDQPEGYIRYQLSWGGPSDEFRFFINADSRHSVHRIEYWFLDWFDGAHVVLSGDDLELMQRVYSDFNDCGSIEHVIQEAIDDGNV